MTHKEELKMIVQEEDKLRLRRREMEGGRRQPPSRLQSVWNQTGSSLQTSDMELQKSVLPHSIETAL